MSINPKIRIWRLQITWGKIDQLSSTAEFFNICEFDEHKFQHINVAFPQSEANES